MISWQERKELRDSMMNKKVLLSVLCTVGITGAAELYVAKSGNDANAGSADAPLATIAKAAKLVNPGDVVHIGPGIYREQIYFRRSGTKDAPIVFAGTRGDNGEYLTIVEAIGSALMQWTPAPEIAPDVWKTPLPNRPDLIMMDGDMITYINRRTMKLPPAKELPKELAGDMYWSQFGENCKRVAGLDLLKLPADIYAKYNFKDTRKELFWPTIGNVIAGWHEGSLYLRFANGSKPEEHSVTASYGDGFTLRDVSCLTFRDLHMRGSRRQFYLKGKSAFNSIEKCLLMHGGIRVLVDEGVESTTIRENIMTSGFIRGDLMGHRSSKDMRGGLLYLFFKYIIGESSSDDNGVCDYGAYNTRVFDNIIMQGLIGINTCGYNFEASGNVVRKMSSIGICTSEATTCEFHHNLVMDCGIPLRIHHFRHKRGNREEYHYCNLFVQPRNAGSQTFVHSESFRVGDDVINFESGTEKYKENPPNPVDGGKIFIYNNTFWGGIEGSTALFSVNVYYKRFRSSLPFFFINNIIKDNDRLSTVTHYLTGPNLLYVFDHDIPLEKRREKDVAKINKIVNLKDSQLIWNKNDIPGLPDITLAPNSPALEAGVDVSKPFTVNGKDYPAFHGFKPGYFKGRAPAAGALQAGESEEKFIAMHLRAENALKMLKEIREKTAAEARRSTSGK